VASYIQKVQAKKISYSYCSRIEAKFDFLNKLKKTVTVLVGTGLFSTFAHGMTFSDKKLDTFAKDVTKVFQDAGVECKVDAKLKKVNDKVFTVSITYKCEDGSARGIKITRVGDLTTNIETGEKKNADGIVNPEIDYAADNMLEILKEEMMGEGFKVK
jgi:hypothetical protein